MNKFPTNFLDAHAMAWALWPDDDHRGVKLHRHFDVPKGVPRRATVTPAACSEPAALMRTLEPNRLSVLDRGYASYELFAEVIAANSSLVARVKDTTAFAVKEEPSIPPAAPAAGVIRDVMKRSMRSRPEAHFPHPVATNPPTNAPKPPPVPPSNAGPQSVCRTVLEGLGGGVATPTPDKLAAPFQTG